jgi:transposase
MKFIPGKDQKQTCLFPVSLEDAIDQDKSMRAIDQFGDQLDLATLGFRQDYIENGPPAYHPSILLKLYIYG